MSRGKEVYNKEQDEAMNVQGVDDALSAVTGMENGVEKGAVVLNPLGERMWSKVQMWSKGLRPY